MGSSSETDIFKKQINWETVLSEIQREIEESPAAKAALNKLVQLGCDRRLILRKLYMYCGGSPEHVLAAKKQFRWRWKFILKLSERLKADAKDINRAKDFLLDAGLDMVCDTEERLSSYAELIERLGNSLLKDLASRRITARDHHLIFLAKMTEKIARRPHYRELADLVAL
jgi:hypothetical protein